MSENYYSGTCPPKSGFHQETSRIITLTATGWELVWHEWDDVYIVYQPASSETHIFNDTTAAVLQSLENGALTMAVVADLTAQALDIEREKLLNGDLSFALGRLEELGLIEWSDEAAAAR